MKLIHDQSKTKIIATIGPACQSKDILRNMFYEGIDACRLNFSHGTHADHLKVINTVRELNEELETHVAIITDLQGPKLRIGEVTNNETELKEGSTVTFVTEECTGDEKKLYMSFKEFPQDVNKGDAVLIDDGKIKLEVTETNRKDSVKANVIYGGKLSSHKGVNLPDTRISIPSLTEKDLNDVEFILKQDIDWIALSFVRHPSDILELKDIIKKHGKDIGVIAKIEKPEAIKEIDNIINVTDAVMVARGDLGVEVPFDEVPYLQKKIVNKCITSSKPVIIATQMLESMIENFRPTRAEANDVANAVFDSADTVMLSGETSVGKFPVESIRSMQRIIDFAEGTEFNLSHQHVPEKGCPEYLRDSVCYNAAQMANLTDATAIVTFTTTGETAMKISSHRPKAAVYAFTPDECLLRKLSLAWGVWSLPIEAETSINDAIDYATRVLKEKRIIKKGDIVVFVGSLPVMESDLINTMKISYIE